MIDRFESACLPCFISPPLGPESIYLLSSSAIVISWTNARRLKIIRKYPKEAVTVFTACGISYEADNLCCMLYLVVLFYYRSRGRGNP